MWVGINVVVVNYENHEYKKVKKFNWLLASIIVEWIGQLLRLFFFLILICCRPIPSVTVLAGLPSRLYM